VKIHFMKFVTQHRLFLILFFFIDCFVLQKAAHSQILHRHMVSAQGGVYTTDGLVFSQSIGQLSVTGTLTTSQLTIQQGFQQSLVEIVLNTISVPDFLVTLYPNPLIDSFTISVANAREKPLTIKITNLLGQVFYQGQLPSFQSEITIPFESYPNGTYLVRLFSDNQIVTKKIIKI